MKRLLKFSLLLAALLGATVLFIIVGTALMRAGVDLVALDARLQGFYDFSRLVHIGLWLALVWRWERLIDWLIARGLMKAEHRQQWIDLKSKLLLVFGLYILLIVIGPTRIMEFIA